MLTSLHTCAPCAQDPLEYFSEKQKYVSIHERNVQILAPEMYKVSNNFSPLRMNEIFKVRNKHPYTELKVFPFKAKSLGYTPIHLQKHRSSMQIQKGY